MVTEEDYLKAKKTIELFNIENSLKELKIDSKIKFKGLSKKGKSVYRQIYLTKGKVYKILKTRVREGRDNYSVRDDLGRPKWYLSATIKDAFDICVSE